MKLKNIFSEITKRLDDLDQLREQILIISRQMVRNCSVAIKSIHRKELSEYEKLIVEVKENHQKLQVLVNKAPSIFSNYLKTPEQEYIEAICLFKLIKDEEIPSPEECEVDDINYLLGLSDVIGELRRHILDNIRNDQLQDIEKMMDKMENLYTYLFSLDYPKGLTKDLRHKTDVARGIIEKTRGDISLSLQLNRLNKNLEKK